VESEGALMKSKFWLSIVAIVMASLAGVGAAADNSWKLPNLNPFASKPKPPTSGRAASSPGWRMPNLLPNLGPSRKSNQPSTWQKMTSGTKNIMSKTTSALNPWDDPKTNQPAASVTGSNSLFSQATSKRPPAAKDDSGGSVLPASWWSSEKKDEPPKSVNEFLARPRPQ
jgi:hypothetical protein